MDNTERENLLEAIRRRHSVRRYTDRPLDTDTVELLQTKIAEMNAAGNLHMQLVVDEPKAFSGMLAYGQFSGVRNYIVVAGRKDDTFDERVGYYGEKLVLYAQLLGLNTCWAGLSYRKVKDTYELDGGEKISCYIAIGYGENQGRSHKIKSVDEVSNAGNDTPSWFVEGVEAALLAPTAVNQQKFRFEYLPPQQPGEKARVLAKRTFSVVGYTKIDLGIAKYHFEIGASPTRFTWARP